MTKKKINDEKCIHPDGCNNYQTAKKDGWCRTHSLRIKKYGEPGPLHKMNDVTNYPCKHPSGNCKRNIFLGKYCRLHYQRLKNNGDVGPVGLMRKENRNNYKENCLVDGCIRKQSKYGYCGMHHNRFIKYGDPGESETRIFIDKAPDGYKTCRNCKEIKIFNEYFKSNTSILHSYCKQCVQKKERMKKYNLTEEEYEKILKINKCQICQKPNKKLCIDHCHSILKFRGVLCNNCNTSIGLLCDDLKIVKSMYEYLLKFREQNN